MDEILLLNNQIAIMWALMVDMPDLEIKQDLHLQIKLTEDRISFLNKNKNESNQI